MRPAGDTRDNGNCTGAAGRRLTWDVMTTDAPKLAGLPHFHTFDEWWAAKRTEPLDSGSVAQQAARQAWDDATAQVRRMLDLMLADLGDLLRAAGMFDGAQPKTPHNLMQEAIARVRRMIHPDAIKAYMVAGVIYAPADVSILLDASTDPVTQA
jgi:hypothetical protein